eukprot:COSAG02_NODE_62050_length_267_cov_0.589286_1_plen_41_part_10
MDLLSALTNEKNLGHDTGRYWSFNEVSRNLRLLYDEVTNFS